MTDNSAATTATDTDWDQLCDLVLSAAGALYGKIAMLLSVCLATSKQELKELAATIWDDDPSDLADAVEQVLEAPYVEETASGWRMIESLAPHLARRFLSDDEESFRMAHETLVERENRALRELESLESSATDDEFDDRAQIESWFSQSRLAFYLAGVHSDQSAVKFGEAFESAPSRDIGAARMWLSTLVFRQEPLLGDQVRVILFFRGFRAYVSGQRNEAKRHFADIIRDDVGDIYEAIALHLHATSVDPVSRISELQKSVTLSEQLAMLENEIMARNSLVSAYFARANKLMKSKGEKLRSLARKDLEQALSLAELNRQRASHMRDRSYQIYTLTQHATAVWLVVQNKFGDATAAQREVQEVLDELSQARTIADSAGMVEPSLIARNQRASVLRDVHRVSEALDELESAIQLIGPVTEKGIVRRLAKTSGSLLRDASNQDKRRITDLLNQFDKWLD
ncbi:hypothetical protein [Streptomyces sp. NPDC029041]|uniref:hypothetical protein n=1 Tax=Streptomyces sp. NPDC029041 TaxID=3155727 RepID=UPI0033F3C27E